jgi:hypothetical protein
MRSRSMSLLPRTTLHSDSEQLGHRNRFSFPQDGVALIFRKKNIDIKQLISIDHVTLLSTFSFRWTLSLNVMRFFL